MKNTVFIKAPEDFSFKATINSHGWRELAPFEIDEDDWRLSYVFRGAGESAVQGVISADGDQIRVDLADSSVDAASVSNVTRHLLRLDEDLGGFYSAIEGLDRLSWVGERRAGRMLRSATVFEDLVKTICTTNCSWAATRGMVSNLVDKLGTPTIGGKRAFPTAEAMAAAPPEFYRNEMRAGYRSPYFVELAEAVASGSLDPQEWLVSDLPTPELKKEMKRVKGVGDYAAENLLKLVGRYDGLALDSWLRSQFYKNHNNEKTCADKKIERHYKKYGEWRGLVIWCDMTERFLG